MLARQPSRGRGGEGGRGGPEEIREAVDISTEKLVSG